MSALVLHAQAAAAVFRRDLAIFTSYRMRLVTTIVATLVTLTVFYYVSRLVRSDKIGSPDDYYAFAVIGILALSVLSAALSRPVATLRAEQLAGTFERMVVSPFGAVRCVISLLLFPLALAFVTSAVSLAFAVVVFGVKLRWPEALAAIPVALLGALAFAPLGLLMTAAVIVFKQTNAGATFVLTACTLLAGVYFPVSLLPEWIRWASEVQPLTPSVDLLRNLLVGTRLDDAVPIALLKLVLFPAVMFPIAISVLRVAVHHSRRRGTITEY